MLPRWECVKCGTSNSYWETPCKKCGLTKLKNRKLKNTAADVPRYSKQGRSLDEQDILRVMVLAIKHIDKEHRDWPELMTYVDKFDNSVRDT